MHRKRTSLCRRCLQPPRGFPRMNHSVWRNTTIFEVSITAFVCLYYFQKLNCNLNIAGWWTSCDRAMLFMTTLRFSCAQASGDAEQQKLLPDEYPSMTWPRIPIFEHERWSSQFSMIGCLEDDPEAHGVHRVVCGFGDLSACSQVTSQSRKTSSLVHT